MLLVSTSPGHLGTVDPDGPVVGVLNVAPGELCPTAIAADVPSYKDDPANVAFWLGDTVHVLTTDLDPVSAANLLHLISRLSLLLHVAVSRQP